MKFLSQRADAQAPRTPSKHLRRPFSTASGAALSSVLLLLWACTPPEPQCPQIQPAASTAAKPAGTGQAAQPKPKEEAPKTIYAGHGAESVPPEILERFAPTPISSDLSRRIQSLLDVRSPGTGMLSPDGKSLYFTWTVTGLRQVWRMDGPQRFPIQITGGEDPTGVADITPDGRYLVLSRDQKGEENPGLYLQDAKNGGALTVIQHTPKVQTIFQFVTPDSRYVYFRANDKTPNSYAIYRYDLQQKSRELVFDQEGIWHAADHRQDGRLLLAKDVGSNMAEYFEYDPKTKALKPLFGQGEREDYVAMYGANDNEVIVHTPKFGEFRRLYVWKEGKFTPISPEVKYDVESFNIDDKKQRILYHVNEGGYSRLHGIDAKTFKEIKLPAFPSADHVIAGSTTPDGKFTTVHVDLGNGPPVSYVAEWQSNKIVQWHAPSTPEIDSKQFVRATLESYPAKDGTKIPMFVFRPASCQKPCPVLVEFHGGPEGQAMAGWNARAQLFVSHGFTFVLPNVRGSDGYGKSWIHADDGAKRLNVIGDIEDCATYIRKNWGDNGKAPKIGIMGGSYGGYSTLMGMTMFAGSYDAGAEIVGISNLITFLQNTAPYRRILRISEYGDPDKDREALTQLSATTHVEKVKGPMLLIQGATDPRVPVGEAVQMYEVMQAKKLPSKLVIFANEGHGVQRRENQVLMFGYVLGFFQEHLQGKSPAKTP